VPTSDGDRHVVNALTSPFVGKSALRYERTSAVCFAESKRKGRSWDFWDWLAVDECTGRRHVGSPCAMSVSSWRAALTSFPSPLSSASAAAASALSGRPIVI
jgi:hypothetical protein